jgi:hypothetical protein
MALPLFAVSTADSKGVLGVRTTGTLLLCSHHTPHKIFQDRFCPINTIPTRKSETRSLVTGTDFRIFFGKKQTKYYYYVA